MWDSLYSPAMERWRWGVRSLSMAARLHFVAAVSVCMDKKTDLCSPPNTGWPCHVWPGRLRKHSPEASGDTDCPVHCLLYVYTVHDDKFTIKIGQLLYSHRRVGIKGGTRALRWLCMHSRNGQWNDKSSLNKNQHLPCKGNSKVYLRLFLLDL